MEKIAAKLIAMKVLRGASIQSGYYYISGKKGMKSNGSFTSDKNKWIVFSHYEKKQIEGGKPYGATKVGAFVSVDKY